MSTIKNESCIFCGSNENITREHRPPKCLFPPPRPSDLIIVPCCQTCNSSFSTDDEYFRNMLVNAEQLYDNENVNLVHKKFLSSLKRKEAKGFATQMVDSITKVDLVSKGGIYVGTKAAMKWDAKRINNTIERISRVVFYKVHCKTVPSEYEIILINSRYGFEFHKEFYEMISPHWELSVSIGNNMFQSIVAVANDDPFSMCMIFWFYGRLFFHAIISKKK